MSTKQTDGAKKRIPGTAAPPAPERVEGIKVRATRTGYYDEKRRREGDVFVISGETYPADVHLVDTRTGKTVLDEDSKPVVRFKKGTLKAFSEVWMERVSRSTPERETDANTALQRERERITGRRPDASNPLGAD